MKKVTKWQGAAKQIGILLEASNGSCCSFEKMKRRPKDLLITVQGESEGTAIGIIGAKELVKEWNKMVQNFSKEDLSDDDNEAVHDEAQEFVSRFIESTID